MWQYYENVSTCSSNAGEKLNSERGFTYFLFSSANEFSFSVQHQLFVFHTNICITIITFLFFTYYILRGKKSKGGIIIFWIIHIDCYAATIANI
jgi:hypothetical protein